jgi:hypothetical protein
VRAFRLLSAWAAASLLLAGAAAAQQAGGYGAPSGYPPPQQGYVPPQQSAPPPQQGYPAQGYAPPPQQGYPAPGYAPPPQQGYPAPGYAPPPQQYPPPQQGGYGQPPAAPPPPASEPKARSTGEITTLYAASAGYGIGLGIWLDAELGVTDPGLALVSPAILGVAAPVGAYFLDQPAMPRGKAAAIAAGLVLGAGEGLGIAGTQFVVASEADAWGFRGLARSVAIGATLGGVGGYVVGDAVEPSPNVSAFVTSGAVWGTLVGGAIGYGASPAGVGYGEANDSGAIGGLVGFNVGLAATAGLSLAFTPSSAQLVGMWEGAGIGAVASLPVYLFYAGDTGPPAKRGLIFSGTAVALGIGVGGLLASGSDDAPARGARSFDHAAPGFASITSVAPFTVPGGGGISAAGILY